MAKIPTLAFVILVAFTSSGSGFVENPLDYLKKGFVITKPRPIADFDQTFEISCQLPEGQVVKKCIINGAHTSLKVNLENGTVTDMDGTVVSGITGITGNPRMCGIMDSALNDEKLGDWSCEMEDEGILHKGSFQLLSVQQGWAKDIRLPRHIEPITYDVTLEPDLDPEGNFTTDGTVSMNFEVVDDSNADLLKQVVVHSQQLIIKESTVVVADADGGEMTIVGHEYDEDRQFYIAHLAEPMEKDVEYTISMGFIAILNDDLTGFYRSTYIDKETGMPTWMAVTQFENTGARQSFPCMDEPDRKANFTAHLIHSTDTIAVSNMPVTEIRNTAVDKVTTSFAETPKVSTYLVAFMVADFGKTVNDSGSVPFTIYHQKSKAEQAKLAAMIGPQILSYYEEYFDLDFPLPAMAMAAIPDFAAGAMENWGLITYRETLLLFDETVSSASNKESITYVVAHELAHQWFGNIVTMKWWTDLWLNEGFATYVEFLGTESVFPEFRYRDRALVIGQHNVFSLDALESSKPITTEVTNPDYDAFFGRIAYDKGGSLLRMIENFMTEEKFRAGLSSYLKKYQYSNAETKDLWNSLTEFAPDGVDISNIMPSWTDQPGYPVVTFDGSALKQERFFLNMTAREDTALWKIPISVAYPTKENSGFDDTIPKMWLMDQEAPFQVEMSPFVINVQESAYYRANYPEENWQGLADLLNNKDTFTKIHELNRAQLIDDSMNLARAGLVDYQLALSLVSYLEHETEYIPWNAAFRALDFLYGMEDKEVEDTESKKLMKVFVSQLLKARYESLGFDPQAGDTHMDAISRSSVIDWMCLLKNSDCIQRAKYYYREWVYEGTRVPADIKDVVYKTAIREGSHEEWTFMYNQFKTVEIDSERASYIYAMGASENEAALREYLNKTIHRDESGIRIQDCTYVYRVVSANRVGRNVAMKWLEDDYDKIKESFGESFTRFPVASIISGYASLANSQEEIDKLRLFFNDHNEDLQKVVQTFNDGLEKARINKVWHENNQDAILDWLKKRVGDDDGDSAAPNVMAFYTLILSALLFLFHL